MYRKIEEGNGAVRVVESHTDELKEAAFYGFVGLLGVKLFYDAFTAPEPPTGLGHTLWMGAAFGGIFMLSLGYSSGFGRLMRGWLRGQVIEVDLKNQRYRRFTRRWFYKKDGGEWQPMGGPPQGAKAQGSARTRVALRVGGERDFVYPTEPGELDDEALVRFIEAINRQLAEMGVESREITATREPRPLTWRLRFRRMWEFSSVFFLLFLLFAFVYSTFIIGSVLERTGSLS